MKLKPLYIISLLLFCSLHIALLKAQQVNVNATMDSVSMLIGEQGHITLDVTYDAKNNPVKIQWPLIPDSISSKVMVVRKSKIDTTIPDKNNPTVMRQSQVLTITCFDSGYYAIPPFEFIINGDTVHKQLTEAMMLQVRTIPVDTSKGFKDIKGPIRVKFSWLELLPYIGWGLLAAAILAAIIYFVLRYLKKRKMKPMPPPVVIEPVIPAHVKALKALEELGMKKLWQEGREKEYHSGITDILREYIFDRYKIGAPEMTTYEIIYALRRSDIGEASMKKFMEVMILSDLVKFAKESPLPNEHELSLHHAIDFVNETKPQTNPA